MAHFRQVDHCVLGIPALDRDHVRLVKLLTRMLSPCWSTGVSQLIRTCVDDLVPHLAQHFNREEMLMRLVGYPYAAQHRQSHAVLLARLSEFQTLLRRNAFPHDQLHDFLAGALLSHLREEDMKLKPWVDRLERSTAA